MSGYHHGNLRSALIESAVGLAREKGADGVVLREVARRTGVSHNAAYRHFADRRELLAEVAGVALDELAATMRRRLGRIRAEDPQEGARLRLKATGRAYVEYAMAEPGMFHAAFTPTDVGIDLLVGPYELLTAALDEGLAAGTIGPDRREGAETDCWSAVHGFALLHLTGPLQNESKAARARALERMLDTLQAGLAP